MWLTAPESYKARLACDKIVYFVAKIPNFSPYFNRIARFHPIAVSTKVDKKCRKVAFFSKKKTAFRVRKSSFSRRNFGVFFGQSCVIFCGIICGRFSLFSAGLFGEFCGRFSHLFAEYFWEFHMVFCLFFLQFRRSESGGHRHALPNLNQQAGIKNLHNF